MRVFDMDRAIIAAEKLSTYLLNVSVTRSQW
jgi:hypothetical protein